MHFYDIDKVKDVLVWLSLLVSG